jgi:hypothetical protein
MTPKKPEQPKLTETEKDALRVEAGERLWPSPADPMAVARKLLAGHTQAGL